MSRPISNQGSIHTCEKAIEFHENLQVDVLTLWRLAMSAAHMVTVQVDTYNFEMTVSFSRSRQAILPSHHIIAVMVGIAFVAGSRNIPMASGIDGTRSRWLAVTPVCKMNFGGVFDLRFSAGRCVRVEPYASTNLERTEFELITCCLRNRLLIHPPYFALALPNNSYLQISFYLFWE